MSGSFVVLLAVSALVPVFVCLLAWRFAPGRIWLLFAAATALLAWIGMVLFVMLHFGSDFAYAAVNAFAPIAAAGLAANVALGALFGFWGLRAAWTGGKE